MATIENVSGTAFVVAEFRAEENTEPALLYTDPIAGIGDIRALAHEAGLEVLENFRTAELHQTYWDGPSDDVANLRLLLAVHARV